MKKICLFFIFAFVCVLSACAAQSGGGINDPDPAQTVAYSDYASVQSDWLVWKTAKEMVEFEYAHQAFIGKITGISFQVHDRSTGLPPEEGALEKHVRERGVEANPEWIFELVTIYDVEVIAQYKGETASKLQFKMMGGLRDVRVEEQLAVMKEYGLKYIHLLEDSPEIKIGGTYLLVLGQLGNGLPSPLNPIQAIYDLRDPFQKNTFSRELPEPPGSYYDKSWDENTGSFISARDVISAFGEEKWDVFWAQWQKENPDWKTRLDENAVKRALAVK